ncbi:SDR family oxidoreductase [Actinomadura darangshiensis]|uniref:SDR family oxidoreductase n=1 Tax=Actinomadura darangshiensis TaxID=705336 RepID=A0A4R5BLR9_9ACTN|nr:SDR family oxidoreductase [Actinomadura darangshiensis]TDD87671.1 SDR family oxidoreductase [Actinomadura darangshiensis]
MPRSVLVTGGARGLGLEIARMFAAAGDAVAVTYRKGEVPDGLLGVRCDVTEEKEVAAALAEVREAHGPVEVLVSNAGIIDIGLLPRVREEDFYRVLDTNLGGAFRVAKAVSRDMIRMRRGRMIFISSVAGFKGTAGQTGYAASKAGLIGFSRSLAREVAKRGITVNVVAPGLLDTDMTTDVPQSARDQILAEVPLGRTARLEEVAATAVWLASDLAGAVTGAVIPVDGGGSMGY